VSFEKQIMSNNKRPSVFLHQMQAIVFIILLAIRLKKLLDSYKGVQFSCNTTANYNEDIRI